MRYKIPMILYAVAIAYFAFELFLTGLIGVGGFNSNLPFVLACVIVVTGLFFRNDSDKPFLVLLFTIVFSVTTYMCALSFFSTFINVVQAGSAFSVLLLLAFLCYTGASVTLIVFARKQFKPNLIVYIMLLVGLVGALLYFVGVLVFIIQYEEFVIDLFSVAIPACFFVGTYLLIKNEFAEEKSVKPVEETPSENASNDAE